MADVGALLTYWTEVSDAPQRNAGRMMPIDERFWRREELLMRYAALCRRDITQAQYYHVLGLYRLIVVAAQIYIRYYLGQTQDARFATYGQEMRGWADAAVGLIQP